MTQQQRRVGYGFVVLTVVMLLVWWGMSRTDPTDDGAAVLQRPEPSQREPANLPAPFEGDLGLLVGDADGKAADGLEAPGVRDDDPAGRVIVRVTWGEDGSPAADVHLRLLEWARSDALFHKVEGVTDERGEWVRERSAPGTVTAYLDRGGSKTGEAVANETTVLEVEIPPGTNILGLVVDPDEQPVPGAEVWLSAYGNHMEGRIVGRADDAGRFVLRSVSAHHHVGALAPGFTPSPIRTVPEDTGPEFSVTLQLRPRGGSVHGLVLDPEGEPAQGATVLVGPDYGWPAPDPRNRLDWSGSPPFRVVTDEQGGFEVDAVFPGRVPVQVRAEGCSPWNKFTEVVAGEVTELTVELLPAGVLFGVVTDGNGRPVPGATISSGRYGEMTWVSTTAGLDGGYELVGPGRTQLPVVAVSEDVGMDELKVHVAPGVRLEWNPVLTHGLQITGVLVDESGAPVRDFVVVARRQSSGMSVHGFGVTDLQGRFMISNCEDVDYILSARPQSSPMAVASLEGVRPGGKDVTIVIPSDSERPAFVIGRVLGPDGLGLPSARAYLVEEVLGNVVAEPCDVDTGAFRIGPMVPGFYKMNINAPGYPPTWLGPYDLLPDQTLDLGTIQFEAPGRVMVRIAVPDGVPADRVSCRVGSGEGSPNSQLDRAEDGSYLSEPLNAGDYELKVSGKFVVPMTRAVRVETGATTTLDITVERGVFRLLSFTMPKRPGPPPELHVTVRDALGTVVQDDTPPVDDHSTLPQRSALVQLWVRPGAYTLLAELDGELVLEEPLPIDDTGDKGSRSEHVLP
jgi:hypothetical protein